MDVDRPNSCAPPREWVVWLEAMKRDAGRRVRSHELPQGSLAADPLHQPARAGSMARSSDAPMSSDTGDGSRHAQRMACRRRPPAGRFPNLGQLMDEVATNCLMRAGDRSPCVAPVCPSTFGSIMRLAAWHPCSGISRSTLPTRVPGHAADHRCDLSDAVHIGPLDHCRKRFSPKRAADPRRPGSSCPS